MTLCPEPVDDFGHALRGVRNEYDADRHDVDGGRPFPPSRPAPVVHGLDEVLPQFGGPVHAHAYCECGKAVPLGKDDDAFVAIRKHIAEVGA